MSGKKKEIDYDAAIEASIQHTRDLRKRKNEQEAVANELQEILLARGLALIKDCFLYEAVSNGKTIDDAMYQKAMDAATSAADLEAITFARANPAKLQALIKKLADAVDRRAEKNAAAATNTKDEVNSVGEDGDEGTEDDQSGAAMMGPLTDEDIEFVG